MTMQIILTGKYLCLLMCFVCLFITKGWSRISFFSNPKDIKIMNFRLPRVYSLIVRNQVWLIDVMSLVTSMAKEGLSAVLLKTSLVSLIFNFLIQLTLDQCWGGGSTPPQPQCQKSAYCHLCLKNKGIDKWLIQGQEADSLDKIKTLSSFDSTYLWYLIEHKLFLTLG